MLSKEKYLDILDKFEFFYGHNLKAIANRKVTKQVEKDRLDNFIRDLDCFRELVYDSFQAKPLKFEDLKKGMSVVDWLRKIVIKIEYINYPTRCIGFEDNKGLHGLMCFDDSIFYPCNYTPLGDDEK